MFSGTPEVTASPAVITTTTTGSVTTTAVCPLIELMTDPQRFRPDMIKFNPDFEPLEGTSAENIAPGDTPPLVFGVPESNNPEEPFDTPYVEVIISLYYIFSAVLGYECGLSVLFNSYCKLVILILL